MTRTQYIVEVITIGIGDKYLTKTITAYKSDNLFHPSRIQFIKDIIQ